MLPSRTLRCGLARCGAFRGPGVAKTARRFFGPVSAQSVEINVDLIACGDVEAVLSCFDGRSADFSDVNVVTALHRLAKFEAANSAAGDVQRVPLSKLEDARLGALLRHALVNVSRLKPRALANVHWALAKLGDAPATHKLFHAIAAAAPKRAGDFSAQELASQGCPKRQRWLDERRGTTRVARFRHSLC
ncbi:hypothetical protein M885DRAFT_498670 [Pelagophyceae sp. CCMP2097]|nr:hypothetical protein M885DRAFT_498670 [Pelagophyceae sp. CCMP2097]|mmetsp:Transcript_1871/g.5592  ORF Transcript_1871/g.5592 Transcript_1871/m.5592 type:complete len:190 (+) Transcript_1871:118-687(+)